MVLWKCIQGCDSRGREFVSHPTERRSRRAPYPFNFSFRQGGTSSLLSTAYCYRFHIEFRKMSLRTETRRYSYEYLRDIRCNAVRCLKAVCCCSTFRNFNFVICVLRIYLDFPLDLATFFLFRDLDYQ